MITPVVPLEARHRKRDFTCGKALLDNYLHRQAGQDMKRKLTACFVMDEPETGLIKGYYTLSNSSISLEYIPENLQRKLPGSYSSIPATLLGRLAVDQRFQGQGIGEYLLIDALKRSLEVSGTIASFALIVDPLDNEAESFYSRYGFIKLPDSGKMFLAMKTVEALGL